MRKRSIGVFLLAAACGGTVVAGDGGPTTDSGQDAGSDAKLCSYQETRTNADRMCMTAGDCTIVVRAVTCCQEQHEGIRVDVAMRFQMEQAALTAGCPGCGCAAQPTDDTGMKGNTSFTVLCEMGLCTSHAL